MKSRETLIRLKKFQVDEKRRRVTQIEGMIADFQRMSVDLEREIQTEQERAGINDPSHFAYPTYAKAAIVRKQLAQVLEQKIRQGQYTLDEALQIARAILFESSQHLLGMEPAKAPQR